MMRFVAVCFAMLLVACGGLEEVEVNDRCETTPGKYTCQLSPGSSQECILSKEYMMPKTLSVKDQLCGIGSAYLMEDRDGCIWNCTYRKTYETDQVSLGISCDISCKHFGYRSCTYGYKCSM